MPNVNKNKVKISGAWASIAAQYVKVDGVWKTVTGISTKVNGTWKTSYPYPLSQDATLATLTVNGSDVLASGTVTVPNGTTSVTVAATTTSPDATVTSGTGTVSVAYSSNPNTKSVVVTAQDGVTTRTYNFNVVVAAPATVTIYWAYCSGYNPPVTGSGVVSGTSDPSTACNQQKAALGNPSNWVCQGTSAPTAPDCGTAPAPCQEACSDCTYTSTDVPCKTYVTCYYHCSGLKCSGPTFVGNYC